MASERFWLEKAKQEREENEKRIQNAYRRIPPEYHDFIILMKQSIKLGEPGADFKITPEMREAGIWYKDGALYTTIRVPYMSVDGRVQWARDEHRKAGKKLIFHPPVIDKNAGLVSVTIESEILGTATGTSKIGNGTGVDRTNPIENAETSAIGRALGFLGYGLIGTGIASAEEVLNAITEQKTEQRPQSPQPQQRQNSQQRQQDEKRDEKKWIVGIVDNYEIVGSKDKNFLEFTLLSGEKIYAPVQYPFKFDIDVAIQLGQQIAFHVIPKGAYYVVSGTTGDEIRLELGSSN